MFKKRMLFLEIPPTSVDWDNPWIFRELGFDVEHRQIFYDLDLLEDRLRLNFADFDVVLVCMEEASPPFSYETIQKFRRELQVAISEKGSPIFLIGVSVNINQKDIQNQNELYENLFLPGLPLKSEFRKRGIRYAFKNLVVSKERMKNVLDVVLSRELLPEEEKVLNEVFPSVEIMN